MYDLREQMKNDDIEKHRVFGHIRLVFFRENYLAKYNIYGVRFSFRQKKVRTEDVILSRVKYPQKTGLFCYNFISEFS